MGFDAISQWLFPNFLTDTHIVFTITDVLVRAAVTVTDPCDDKSEWERRAADGSQEGSFSSDEVFDCFWPQLSCLVEFQNYAWQNVVTLDKFAQFYY